MNRLKYQTLISSTKTTVQEVEELISEIQVGPISQLFDLLLYLEHTIERQSEPHPKLNCILCLIFLLKKASYPVIALLELVFLDFFQEPARLAASNSPSKVYDYFQSIGAKWSSGNLQTLSYHFAHSSLEFCLILAYIKPKQLYRNKQCSSPSRAKTFQNELREKMEETAYNSIYHKYNFLALRKTFVSNIIKFHKSPHAYIDFFMLQMEQYLLTSTRTSHFNWFRGLSREGDVYLTSEALARLGDIFCFHKNFIVKRNSLQLISEMIFWGDLEGLLMINFTEYFGIIASRIIEAKQKSHRMGVFCIFPQIDGQSREKDAFYNEFLLCVRRFATIFPTLDAYFVNSGQSPIYQLYVKLLEHGIVFPSWDSSEQYEAKMLKNFRNKKEHNDLFLQQLDKQKGDPQFKFNPLRPTVRNIVSFYQRNKENLQKFLDKKDLDSSEWAELIEFRKHFQEYLQRAANEASQQELDELIEDGLQLEYHIEYIEQLSLKLKQKSITIEQFQKAIKKPPSKPEQTEKISSLKESLRSREKDSLKYSLTQSAQMIKSKMSAKIQQLVTKRSDVPLQVSQLQLFSRPFLANQLHSKQIAESLVPLLQLHPLRKQKRSRCGIHLLKQPEHQDGRNTPKFRSFIGEGSKKGIRVLKKKENKLDKYVAYLNDSKDFKYFSYHPIKFSLWDLVQIERSELLQIEDKLQVNLICSCPNSLQNFNYQVNEEPSVKICSESKIVDQNTMQIQLTAQFVKFGFTVPTIKFSMQNQQPKSFILPFSLHNFLRISPIQPFENSFVQRWAIPYSLKPAMETNYSQWLSLIKGLNYVGKDVGGRVELRDWSCNVWMSNDGGNLGVEVEAGQEIQGNILAQLLPLIATKLLTEWNQAISE